MAEMNRRAEAEPDLRRDLVNSIVGRARQYEERGQYNDACGQWDILRNIHPAYPGIDFELERLARRKEEHVQSEAKSRWMERVDRAFASGEYSKARGIIDEALTEFPGDKELLNLTSLASQGVQRSAEALLLLKEGQDLCATQRVAEGLESLRKAERLDPRNSTARATLLGALVHQARGLLPEDWRAAESLVKEAMELDSGDPVARSLASQIDDHRRHETVGQVLIDARNLQAAQDVPAAVQRVEEGLATYPNEVRLSQLHNTLRNLVPDSGRETPALADPPTETILQAAPLAFAATVAGQWRTCRRRLSRQSLNRRPPLPFQPDHAAKSRCG